MGETITRYGDLSGACGWNGAGWEKILIDSSKRLVIALGDWPGTPVIYNVTMTLANTEYPQALPANTRKFMIKCRGSYNVKVCFASGQSGTIYLTIPANMAWWEDQISVASGTLYFQCATAGQVAEIVAWS